MLSPSPRYLLLWLPLALVVAIAGSFHALGWHEAHESASVLTVFNTLFLGAVGLFTAALALQTARVAPRHGIAVLGCAALILGLVSILAGPLIHDLNVALTLFNTGGLVAGLLFLLAALRALRGPAVVETDARHALPTLIVVYAACVGVVALLALAARAGLSPLFYAPGQGSTPLRDLVLGLTVALFAIAALVFALGWRRSQLGFAAWFAAALTLFSVGFALAGTALPGSPAGWTGRASQWLAALYLLGAIFSAQRALGAYTLPLRLALQETELRLRLALDAAGIGVLEYDRRSDEVHLDDTVRRQLGLAEREPLSLAAVTSALHADDRARVASLLDDLAASPAGQSVEFEFRTSDEGGPERWLVIRGEVVSQSPEGFRLLGVNLDITERKRSEALQLERMRLAEALTGIDGLVHSTLSPQEILRQVIAQAAEALGCALASVVLRGSDGRWSVPYLWGLPQEMKDAEFSDEQLPLVALCTARRTLVLASDLPADLRSSAAGLFGDLEAGLCVPLQIAERVIGALAFHDRAGHHFDDAQLDYARKLATSVSLALTNAHLYEEQRRVANTLQEHLRHPLPEIPGLDLAVVTEVARAPELVGGDFHDVFALPDGCVAVLLGDVEGKGVRAAGLGETVRSAVRSLCFVDPSPAYVLGMANRLLLNESVEQHVTALLVVFNLTNGAGRLASAGHPAPLCVGDGRTEYLEPAYGLPLGAFELPYEERPFSFLLGETLIFYTDGLTEARRAGELFGQERLRIQAAQLRARDAADLVAGLRAAALAHADEVTDDLEILAVRYRAAVAPECDGATPKQTTVSAADFSEQGPPSGNTSTRP